MGELISMPIPPITRVGEPSKQEIEINEMVVSEIEPLFFKLPVDIEWKKFRIKIKWFTRKITDKTNKEKLFIVRQVKHGVFKGVAVWRIK